MLRGVGKRTADAEFFAQAKTQAKIKGRAAMLDHACGNLRAPLSERGDDLYDTPRVAVEALIRHQPLPHHIWEPACGTGNIVRVLRRHGHLVDASDLNRRGCPNSYVIDFLRCRSYRAEAIVTNPPFRHAAAFVELGLARAPLVVMLLRLAFLESERRAPVLDNGTLARVMVFAKRLPMMHRAGWEGRKANSAMAFAWFVWKRDHSRPATIERIWWQQERKP
jgi:hypothetical protein